MTTNTPARERADAFKVACSSCNLRELCLPVGLNRENLDKLDALVARADRAGTVRTEVSLD